MTSLGARGRLSADVDLMQKKSGRGKWIALAIVGAIVLVLCVAFFLVKRSVRREIEEQCSSALQGSCTIDSFSLSSDGASANHIHVDAKLGMASGDIEWVVVRFAWWPLLTGSKQGISVRVVAPKITGGIPIGNVVREAQRMIEGLSPDKNASRVRLDSFNVERGDVRVSIPIVADVHVEAIEVEWKRDGRFSLQWNDASFESLLTSERTGECTISEKKDAQKVHVACGKRAFDVEVDRLEDVADLVKIFLKAKK